MKKKPRKMIKHYNKMKKSNWEMSKKYNFFTIFLQTKFQAKILVPKTSTISQKFLLNSYRFCGIEELKE